MARLLKRNRLAETPDTVCLTLLSWQLSKLAPPSSPPKNSLTFCSRRLRPTQGAWK